MSERGIRSVVIAVDLFEAVSAVVGAVGLVVGFMAVPAQRPERDALHGLHRARAAPGRRGRRQRPSGCGRHRVRAPAARGAGFSGGGGITVGYLTIEIALIVLGSWAQMVWLLVGVLMIGLAALLWQAETYAAGVGGSHQPV
jgi:hypothetical protein